MYINRVAACNGNRLRRVCMGGINWWGVTSRQVWHYKVGVAKCWSSCLGSACMAWERTPNVIFRVLMQHSPQEIKIKLSEAVDPEGNVCTGSISTVVFDLKQYVFQLWSFCRLFQVLNMAAVVEVIGLLERTPITKEALEVKFLCQELV